MSQSKIPMPSPGFKQQVAGYVEPPLTVNYSGQITAATKYDLAGVPRFAGHIGDVILSVAQCGRDDTNTLSLEADVLINGTTCLTTKPKIVDVQAVASTHRTTNASGQGITQAVMSSANSYSAGDIITVAWSLTRTASPTTEMANAALVIELRPD